MYQIKSKRHQEALEYAMEQIKKSPLFPYITGVWLFGSCARGEQKYDSDVDLFMELALSETDFYEKRNDVLFLKGTIAPVKVSDPDVDLKVSIDKNWKQNTSLIYQEIRKDGIQVWPEH